MGSVITESISRQTLLARALGVFVRRFSLARWMDSSGTTRTLLVFRLSVGLSQKVWKCMQGVVGRTLTPAFWMRRPRRNA
jgi:hypothetical protein